MCGILGTTNLLTSNEVVMQALDHIIQRGPDNQSIKSNGKVIFGHTRLSIVDLDVRSNQPFTYFHKERSIFLTFNGEIYNFIEIREALIVKGYKFNTESDTEVVCAAYCEYGMDCFDLFEGMWAIAINEEEKLILSRDRVGKKPLHYSVSKDENVHFGSSLRSVQILTNNKQISSSAVELYFALGFIPSHFTIYSDIYKVEPGKIMVFEKSNSTFNLILEKKSNFNQSNFNKSKTIKKQFFNAVNKRLISDVPVATLMSGGIDSTIVTVLINKIKPKTPAFFVDFDDAVLSENKWANYLAKRNKIKLNTLLLSSEKLQAAFQDYYKVYEEPFSDYSGIPSIAIFKHVSSEYKVILTGDGGDELFYGYPSYHRKYVIFTLFDIIKLFKGYNFLSKKLKKIVSGNKSELESNFLKNHGVVSLFASKFINDIFNKNIKKSFIKGVINYDREFYNIPEKYMVKIDRASMFSGVEVRSPFLDEHLLSKVKITSLWLLFTPYSSKLYLKLIYFKLFGFKYLKAAKKGFTPPIQNLRDNNFKEKDYIKLKNYLEVNYSSIANQINLLQYSSLLEDLILFDRFFFFNEWLKRENLI